MGGVSHLFDLYYRHNKAAIPWTRHTTYDEIECVDLISHSPMNTKGNLADHIKKVKGKTEAAFQNIIAIAGNQEFTNIKIIWKLVNSCIIPTIMYGAETWMPRETEMKNLQKILDNVLKRIIKTPRTTPTEIISAETGIWSIKLQMWKKQIMYLHKIVSQRKDSTIYRIMTNKNNPWLSKVEEALKECGITMETINQTNTQQLKQIINKRLNQYQQDTVKETAELKSKVRHYVSLQAPSRPTYMNKLSRIKCADIFRIRSRMLKVKGNYKTGQQTYKCRWCKDEEETQEHILSECSAFKDLTKGIKYCTYFTNNMKKLKKILAIGILFMILIIKKWMN